MCRARLGDQGTLWLAQPVAVAVADGVLHTPGSNMLGKGDLVGRIDTTPVAIYWGEDATPEPAQVRFDNVTDEPVELPAVRLGTTATARSPC